MIEISMVNFIIRSCLYVIRVVEGGFYIVIEDFSVVGVV